MKNKMGKKATPTITKRISKKKDLLGETRPDFQWIDSYVDYLDQQEKQITDLTLKELSKELIEWARNDGEAIRITQFLSLKRIPSKNFYRWIEKSPEFKEAHTMALRSIADRRELGGLTRKYDPSFVHLSMAKYDPEWKEYMQWRASLKEKSNEQGPIAIYMDGIKLGGKDESKTGD